MMVRERPEGLETVQGARSSGMIYLVSESKVVVLSLGVSQLGLLFWGGIYCVAPRLHHLLLCLCPPLPRHTTRNPQPSHLSKRHRSWAEIDRRSSSSRSQIPIHINFPYDSLRTHPFFNPETTIHPSTPSPTPKKNPTRAPIPHH